MKHTPAPWHLRGGYSIFGGDREIGIVWKGDTIEEKPLDEANASHIMRCVNSHDALVAALEHVLFVHSVNPGRPEWLDVVDSAIKLARGEE